MAELCSFAINKCKLSPEIGDRWELTRNERVTPVNVKTEI